MLLKLIPDQTKIPFTSWRMIAAAISAALLVGSVIAVSTLGLNFGVDFKGGVTIEVVDEEPIDLGAVRSNVGGLGLGGSTNPFIRNLFSSVLLFGLISGYLFFGVLESEILDAELASCCCKS